MLLATPIGGAFIRRRADTAGMAKKPEPPKLILWTIYKVAAKAVRWVP
jgi:hypothetical protein